MQIMSNSQPSSGVVLHRRHRRLFNCRELVVLGVFAAAAKVVTLVIALAGGGLNPISLILKNLVFTTLLVVLLYKVRKPGTLTLFALISGLISFLLLGGGLTSVPTTLTAALGAEAVVLLLGGTRRFYAPVLAAALYDLISKGLSLGVSYLIMRESPGLMVVVVIIVGVGYIGSLIGLYTGVRSARELKHAGIIH